MFDTLLKELNGITTYYVYSLIDEYMTKNKTKILNMAKDRMKRGEGVKGGIIGAYRSLSYEIFKDRMNPLAGGTVDLFLTGDLQRGMTIEGYEGVYRIYSTDSKYTMLASKYGANQFGLTDEQHDEIINDCMNYIISKINEKFK